MEIEFSDHALEQLEKRPTISKEMVVETINSPEERILSFRQRKLYRKGYIDQVLEVVTIVENDKMIVVTEYFLEK